MLYIGLFSKWVVMSFFVELHVIKVITTMDNEKQKKTQKDIYWAY